MVDSTVEASQGSLQKVTWVGCDSCGKWRKVPQALADSLDDTTKWYCEQNPDVGFNSCDTPQELTDQEIDQALAPQGGVDDSPPLKSQRPAIWQHITENILTHRSRKVEHEDDIMVCQCRPPRDGGPGCGEDCLNRMLNQECNQEYCPCGTQCSNTQFTKRQYANIEQRRAGPKGFGLFTNQALAAGQFIIEYVGEVLEEEEYLRRKVFYQEIGQRHYYFMNVGNGEVIDACRKGALGRFINHSCDPNCETQKWVVHGELAIGLFVLKDVPAGQELTFDYNFERYGDKALRCYCRTSSCRGYIGGTPEEHDVDTDGDENIDASNDPEPIMVGEEEATCNPACQAILANEVGLASADFQDDRLRTGWEDLAGKYGMSLDWDAIGRGMTLPAESAEESKAMNGDSSASPATFEAVEQKLKDSKAHRKMQALAQSKAAASQKPRKRLTREGAHPLTVVPPAVATPSSHTPATSPSSYYPQRQHSKGQQRGFRRRSEVDRRLDTLVAGNGKLRESGSHSIIRMLRLFNLCDLGTSSHDAPADKAENSGTSSKSARGQFWMAGEETKPLSETLAHRSEHSSKRRRVDGGGEGSPDNDREEGEIGMRRGPGEGQKSAQIGRAEAAEEAAGSPRSHQESDHLNGRQKASMADLSLLLDVILKTTATSARREFCKCGILRQLQSVVGRCTGMAYVVIIKKILRAIDTLPITAEEMHQHSSAHGSFADTLWILGGHSDLEVRTRAQALRKKYPLEACNPQVQEAAKSARAAATARRAQQPVGVPPPRRWGTPAQPYGSLPGEHVAGRPASSGGPRPSKFISPPEAPSVRDVSEPRRRTRDPAERERLWSNSPASVLTPMASNDTRGALPSRSSSAHVPQFSSPLPTSHAQKGSWNGAVHGVHRLHKASNALDTAWQGGGQHQARGQQQSISPTRQSYRHASPTRPRQALAPQERDSEHSPPGGFHASQSAWDSKVGRHQSAPLGTQARLRAESMDVATLSQGQEASPVTPRFQQPPPLPTGPPPPPPGASPVAPTAFSPMSTGLPSVSPITPEDSEASPRSPALSTGAYMEDDDGASQESEQEDSQPQGNGLHPLANRSGWRTPAWQSSLLATTPGSSTLNAALAAPLPAPGVHPTNAAAPPQLPQPSEAAHPKPPESDGAPSTVDGDFGSPSPNDAVQSWERPNSAFEESVGRVIGHRLGKYKQPEHPNCISHEEFRELYRKCQKSIIEAERKAYEERQRNKNFKVIERSKLEARIKEYVRDLIHRHHNRKNGRV